MSKVQKSPCGSTKDLCFKFIILTFVILIILAETRIEERYQEADQKIINELVTLRDKEHNKVFQKVTFEGLKQEEIRQLYLQDKRKKQPPPPPQQGPVPTPPKAQPEPVKKKPTEIFFPSDQTKITKQEQKKPAKSGNIKEQPIQKVPDSQAKRQKEMLTNEQELIAKLSQNISNILQERLNQLTQDDLENLMRRGFIDEAQALILFELFIQKQINNQNASLSNTIYSLKDDLHLGGIIPLVYSLHFCLLALAFAISMVHKHFTLRISVYLFLLVKLIEIMLFYFFALYLQNSGCSYFSIAVHIIFDLTIYNLLLDILSFWQYKSEDFEFDFNKEGNKDKLKGKIIFNITLLSISYVSCIQFTSKLACFFLYWYAIYLVFRLILLCKDRSNSNGGKKQQAPTQQQQAQQQPKKK